MEPSRHQGDLLRAAPAVPGVLWLAAAGLGIALAARAAAQVPTDSLTVLEVARRAMERAPEVRAAGADARAAGLDARAAARNRLPGLDFHSSVLVAPDGYDPAITNLGEYDLKLIGTVNVADGGTRRREQLRARAAAIAALGDLA